MFICSLFIFSLFASAFGKYNIFENATIELQYNEIAYFSTPDYPLMHNSSNFFTKNVTFFTNESSANGTRCIFVLQGLTWYYAPFKNNEDIFIFNVSTFYLEVYHYNLQFFNAYQGYIYFENWDDSCPFESFSRDVPYLFEDETQIIFIASVYENKTNLLNILPPTPSRLQSCKWQFIAPEGFGLKLVIQNFDISSTTKFRMHNSTTLILNERSARAKRPYYIADNYTQIYLSKDNLFSKTIEFAAYVSIVKKSETKTDGNCIITNGNGTFSWASSTNLTHGYKNNVFCNYEVEVKSGTTVMATVEQCSLERYVDSLTYFDDQYTFILDLKDEFVLYPFKNGSNKKYTFHFVTDGSYVTSGFKITFMENACQCSSESNILCNNGTFTVMPHTDYVCPFLKCSFKILPCPTPYSSLTINLYNYTDLDFIKVISNNITVYNSALTSLNFNGAEHIYLNSKYNNILEISSVARSRKNTTFILAEFELPPLEEHAILRENGTNYVLDASVINYAIVETEEALENTTIIVYGRNNEACSNSLYYNESLTEKIIFENCDKSTAFFKCVSNVKKIVYFYHAIVVNCFISFSLRTHEKHCVFNTTNYFVQGNFSVVSVLSNHDGACKITILKELDRSYILSDTFTTAKDSDVEIWFGKNQRTSLLQFNERTRKKWINVLMMSEVYGVYVPKGASLLLTFVSVKLPFEQQIISAPFYSLIASPHYGSKRCATSDNAPFVSFKIANVIAKFTVLQIKENDEAYFLTDTEKIRINRVGEIFIFINQSISLFFKSTAQNYCGLFVEVEAVEYEMNNNVLIE